jgi:hypothetical protein
VIANYSFAGKLNALQQKHFHNYDKVRDNDPVRDALDALLANGSLGTKPAPDVIEARRKEAKRRVEAKIPPGHADAKKEDPTGDYLLWSELVEHIEHCGRPMLFVTNDEKEDWYYKINGQRIGPRPELRAEMYAASPDHAYHHVPLGGFLQLAKEHLHAEVEDETIEIVERTARESEIYAERSRLNDWQAIMRPAFKADWYDPDRFPALRNFGDIVPTDYDPMKPYREMFGTDADRMGKYRELMGSNFDPMKQYRALHPASQLDVWKDIANSAGAAGGLSALHELNRWAMRQQPSGEGEAVKSRMHQKEWTTPTAAASDLHALIHESTPRQQHSALTATQTKTLSEPPTTGLGSLRPARCRSAQRRDEARTRYGDVAVGQLRLPFGGVENFNGGPGRRRSPAVSPGPRIRRLRCSEALFAFANRFESP